MRKEMNGIKKKGLIGLLVLLTILSGCAPQSPGKNEEKAEKNMNETKENLQLFFLNSILVLDIRDERDDKQEIQKEVQERMQDIEEKMSLHMKETEIQKINAKAGIEAVEVSEDSYKVIESAVRYAELSKGKFDISVGSLVELWGIGTEEERVPAQEEIEQALATVDYREIELDPEKQSVYLKKEGMKIDLGAIAKGYAADQILEILKKYQVESAIVNLAGNIFVHGDKGGQPFKVGIQDPFQDRGTFVGIYAARDLSVVTSGVYERFFEQDGERYHHILSTKDGYPVNNELVSVSILSEKSMDGDALSTSVFAMGLEEGMKLIESLEGVEAICIDREKNIYLSSGAGANFELTDTSFSIRK